MAILGVMLFVLDLGLGAGSALYKWYLAEKVERLRAEGHPISATVSNFREVESGSALSASTFDISYEYGGQSYRATVKCGVSTECDQAPGPEMTVLVDPNRPEDFITHDGNTDAVVIADLLIALPFIVLIATAVGFMLFVAVKGGRGASTSRPLRGGGTRGSP